MIEQLPFSGTHFGHPRLFSVRVRLSFPKHQVSTW